jgi:mono/diheme cytochrome c family protein
MSRRTIFVVGFAATSAAALILLASPISCSPSSLVEYEPYPVYPLRTDPVVVANPPTDPTGPAPPGELDAWVRQHTARGGKLADPNHLTDQQKTSLASTLDRLFGTPIQPIVYSPKANDLGLSNADELAEASKLYRRHCSNCHGLTGDGRAPAGLFVYPHPRDFRLGLTKFGGTADGTPTRNELFRIIKSGIAGTSMPPFQLLDDRTVQLLVGSTIHLSLRGEVEAKLIAGLLGDDPPDDLNTEANRLLDRAIDRWWNAKEIDPPTAVPPLDADRIRRGEQLFTSAKTGCSSCHVDYGRQDRYRFDAWGTAAKVANLADRELRGGSDPAVVHRRIRLGIPAVGMPALPTLTDDEIWDLTAFVLALPKPMMQPEDVRAKVQAKP